LLDLNALKTYQSIGGLLEKRAILVATGFSRD